MEQPSTLDTSARRADSAAEAIHRRISEDLYHGLYTSGARLPSERDLAVKLGTSRVTLRSALARLAAEGRLTPSRQRGWFVSAVRVGEPPSTLQSFTEMARSRGLVPRTRVLIHLARSCTYDESVRLVIAPAARVVEVKRVRSLGETPVCVDHSVIHVANADDLMSADLEDASLYETLERRCALMVARSAFSMQARGADDEVSGLLDIRTGSPVLAGEETAYDEDGHAVIIGHSTYRGDAYRFEADLFRPVR